MFSKKNQCEEFFLTDWMNEIEKRYWRSIPAEAGPCETSIILLSLTFCSLPYPKRKKYPPPKEKKKEENKTENHLTLSLKKRRIKASKTCESTEWSHSPRFLGQQPELLPSFKRQIFGNIYICKNFWKTFIFANIHGDPIVFYLCKNYHKWFLVEYWVNIARGTTDPGYWLFNLSYLPS